LPCFFTGCHIQEVGTAQLDRAISVPLARNSGRVNRPTHRSAKSAVPVSGELEHPVTRD
jgi:hypothetical protein